MMDFLPFMRRVAPAVLAASAALGFGAEATGAQQPARAGRRVMVRVDSNETMKVTVVLDGLDSLLRSLAQSRALEERIGMALREYGGAQPDEARKRALEEQLQKLTENNVRLMSRIQMACTNQKSSDRAPEGYLGVTFAINGSTKRENNGPEVYRFDEPPEVITVEMGSPADRAGVRSGDRIIAMDGRELVGRDVILSQLLVPGRKLPLRLLREDREMNVVAQVQKRPDGFGDQCTDLDLTMLPMKTPGAVHLSVPRGFTVVRPAAPAPPTRARTPMPAAAPEAPAAPSVWTFEAPPPVAIAGFSSLVAGAQLTTLTEDFKELTGADAGVMVQRVMPESPAATAGLRGGDVIVEAGDRPVTSARFLQRMIGGTDQHTLKLKVVRKGKARTVWLKW